MKKVLSMALLASLAFTFPQKDTLLFYVGAQGPNAAITLCELNLATGAITTKSTFSELKGPGYLSLAPDQKTLYAVTQDDKINALAVGPNGELKYLNSQSSEGRNPCHVSVHPTGKMAFLANYTGGSMAAYPVQKDGTLAPASATNQFSGKGPNPQRQEGPHAHCALSTPNGKYLYVSDLGTDRLMNYVVDAGKAQLSANPAQGYFSVKAGAGPRHMVLHGSGKYLFLLNELDATLVSCRISDQGVLSEIQTVNTLPADFKGANKSAAIRLHPNGKYVYASNRGYNGITAYRIGTDGRLEQVDTQTQGIDTPRDFNVDPTGKYLLVANQETNDLVVYDIDAQTGTLRFRQKGPTVAGPTCIVFKDK
ncbi:lactonase family protein [Rhabdobacter roseus]|uniref:6-phosphogluconolactonase n=1 Tax=Rhabdobacter roseus TaxID=1655419 RepID=A0A840TN67_9BACT|nr:lactonase family protein [Rhabdobacter roseus]MBB5285716.1 6-phosphogluconolactonase [Rhabdobacter roseus]